MITLNLGSPSPLQDTSDGPTNIASAGAPGEMDLCDDYFLTDYEE